MGRSFRNAALALVEASNYASVFQPFYSLMNVAYAGELLVFPRGKSGILANGFKNLVSLRFQSSATA
jgi:hypothetical protein